jgi:hypothetical protein
MPADSGRRCRTQQQQQQQQQQQGKHVLCAAMAPGQAMGPARAAGEATAAACRLCCFLSCLGARGGSPQQLRGNRQRLSMLAARCNSTMPAYATVNCWCDCRWQCDAVRLLQGVYFGCTNGSILCIDPESSALLGTTAALQPEPAAAAVSSIAVNKEAVVSASSSSPQLAFYSRCSCSTTSSGKQQQQQQQQGRGLQLLGSARASTQGELQVRCCRS